MLTLTKVKNNGQSRLKAVIGEGRTATITNWRKTGLKLVVSVEGMAPRADPPYASISIAFGPQSSPNLISESMQAGMCGNSICDPEENPSSCPSDCSAQSFKIEEKNDASADGHMFTVEASKDLTIFSFDVFGKKSGNSECMVFTRPGAYIGHEEDQSAWRKVMRREVVFESGKRSNLGALVPEISISAGSTQSFYVHCDGGLQYAKGDREGKLFDHDGWLEIYQGMVTSQLFQKVTGVGKFSGWIRYDCTSDLHTTFCEWNATT